MKLLVVIDNMQTGGIASSLYNFLEFLDYEKIECDLCVFNHNGISQSKIPANVNLIKFNDSLSLLGLSQSEVKKQSSLLAFKRLLLVLVSRLCSGNTARKLLFRGINFEEKSYDLALAYSHDLSANSFTPGCRQFISEKINATKKAVYIHCDYKNYGGYSKKQLKDYNAMDFILCVSDGCKKSFLECFQQLKVPVYIQENFTNQNDIIKMASKSITYDERMTFVSVCRLSKEKGIERCLNVFYKIREELGNAFEWVIVGDGSRKNAILNQIKKYGLEENVKLVGKKDNPYVYMKNANYFLLPSIHEAAPMVYAESATLGVPVITTRTTSAEELVAKKRIGFVCENSEDGLLNILRNVIIYPDSYKLERDMQYAANINAAKQLDNWLHILEK